MKLLVIVGVVTLGLMGQLAAQQPSSANWQELALRAQQNATTDQMIANGMLSTLQAEMAALKAEIARMRQDAAKPADAPAK